MKFCCRKCRDESLNGSLQEIERERERERNGHLGRRRFRNFKQVTKTERHTHPHECSERQLKVRKIEERKYGKQTDRGYSIIRHLMNSQKNGTEI